MAIMSHFIKLNFLKAFFKKIKKPIFWENEIGVNEV